jgi:hypothetical protein
MEPALADTTAPLVLESIMGDRYLVPPNGDVPGLTEPVRPAPPTRPNPDVESDGSTARAVSAPVRPEPSAGG